MRQVWVTRAGPPEVLQVKEAADPVAGAGEVRVRVKAAGVNFADLMGRQGLYPDAPPVPFVPGYEVSGVIDQVGEGVEGHAIGDRVFGMPKFGAYTDTLVIAAPQAIPMPASMSFEDAAALPVAYLTAHHMMLFTGSLRAGMRVLIHSAAGGVGLAAVQLGRAHGVEMIGTASPGKHDYLRSVGVQHPIDSGGDIPAQVRAIFGPEPRLDLVLDPVAGRSFKDGYAMLGEGGRLVCFGVSSMAAGKKRNLFDVLGMVLQTTWWTPYALMNDNKTVSGVNMGHLFGRIDLIQPQFAALLAMYERGEIKPHVDRTFPLAEAPAAHHFLHDRKAKGKVLLVP